MEINVLSQMAGLLKAKEKGVLCSSTSAIAVFATNWKMCG